MAVTATTNTAAQTAIRYLSINSANTSSALAKLSSGSRIVKASDDAASLAVGTKLRADVAALKVAAVNASHGSSVLQVADGGLAAISDILQRMKALSVQAQSGSLSDTERGLLDKEYQELLKQVDDVVAQTRFNNEKLIDGSYSEISFQVGVSSEDVIEVSLGAADAESLTIATTSVTTAENAVAASDALDSAIESISELRAEVGALISRFEFAGANVAIQVENLDAARSVLMDVDMAQEMTNFVSAQVLTQAATAMLAQANQLPQNLLRLLQ